MDEDIFQRLAELRDDPNTSPADVDEALRSAGLGQVADSLVTDQIAQQPAGQRSDIFDRSRQRSNRLFGDIGQSRLGQSRLEGSVTRRPDFGRPSFQGSVTRSFDRPRLEERLAPKLPEILEPQLRSRLTQRRRDIIRPRNRLDDED